jgi:hypothetical protein
MEEHSQQTEADVADSQSRPTCFVCQRAVADDQWFCRLTQKVKAAADPQAARILLCSPACALRYFAESKTEPAKNTEAGTNV